MGILQCNKSDSTNKNIISEPQETIQLPDHSEKTKDNIKMVLLSFKLYNLKKKANSLNAQLKDTVYNKYISVMQNRKSSILNSSITRSSTANDYLKLSQNLFYEIQNYNKELQTISSSIQFLSTDVFELKNELFDLEPEIIKYYDELITKHYPDFCDKLTNFGKNKINNISFLNDSSVDQEENNPLFTKTLEHLLDYQNKNNESLLLDYVFQKGFLPYEIKQLINQFIYLNILKKLNFLENTKNYIKLDKKGIKKIIKDKNVYYLEKEEIIEEDYVQLFELLKKGENLNNMLNNNNFNQLHTMSSTSKNNFNLVESKNNVDVLSEKVDSNMSFKKQGESKNSISNFMDGNINFNDKIETVMDMKYNSNKQNYISNSSLKYKDEKIIKTILPHHEKINLFKENKFETNPNQDDEEIVFKNKPKNFTKFEKEEIPTTPKLKVRFQSEKEDNIIHELTENNKFNFDDFEMYIGELDIINYLYAGTGKLYKFKNNNIYSFYHGTFKTGKKNGIGIFYRKLNDNQFEYFRGEFNLNKFEGYGVLFSINKSSKTIFKGKFFNNSFVYGHSLKIIINDIEKTYQNNLVNINSNDKKDIYSNFKNNYLNYEICIEKYEGDFKDDLYSGIGNLIRRIYKKCGTKFELESEYEYSGQFLDNLENGSGLAINKSNSENYSYKYTGEFVKGEKHGAGRIDYYGEYYIEHYEGIFLNNKSLSVYGKVKFRSGDEYEGFFNSEYQKTGPGLYFHYDRNNKKEHFFGKFANDKKDGVGRYAYPKEFKVLAGKYQDGEKNGNFYLTSNQCEDQVLNEKKGSVSSLGILNVFSSHNNKIYNTIRATIFDNSRIRTDLIKQNKIYFYCENDEIVEKSDMPIPR